MMSRSRTQFDYYLTTRFIVMYESPQIRANSAPYIPLSLSLGILLPALATSTSLREITSGMSSVKLY